MNKKSKPTRAEEILVSQEKAVEIIQAAQKRTSSPSYDQWISSETKTNFGNEFFEQCKRLLKHICTLIMALGVLWLVVVFCKTFNIVSDKSGLNWFHDMVSGIVDIVIFKIIPAVTIFFFGKYVEGRKK